MAAAAKHCFFDISIGRIPVGRIVFELRPDVAPNTCLNFATLCSDRGSAGLGKTTGFPLSYEGTIIHRSIRGFMLQGGDFSKRDGTGGESIFGGRFKVRNRYNSLLALFFVSKAAT